MDINDKIAANKGLIYQQLARFNLLYDPDAESYAYEALYKAILTYNENAGAVFSTYAVCVIANALRHHVRTLNKKRQLEVISYHDTVSDSANSDDIIDTLLIPDTKTDAEAIVLFKELSSVVTVSFKKVLKTLTPLQQDIIATWYTSDCKMTQSELAKALHTSQPTVSKALSVFKYRLKLELEEYM